MSLSIPLSRPFVLADLIPGDRVRSVALVVGGAALTGLSAQVSFPLPGTPVPVTLQTLSVLLVGAALGWRLASFSMLLYVVAGMAGVPWFAGGASGMPSATSGYLIGFILAGATVGALAGRGGDRTPLRAMLTMTLGTLLIYAVGVPWLAVTLDVNARTALAMGVAPFLVGDALKVAAAAGILPAAWALTGVVQKSV